MVVRYASAKRIFVVLNFPTNFLSKTLPGGGIDTYEHQKIDVRRNLVPINMSSPST